VIQYYEEIHSTSNTIKLHRILPKFTEYYQIYYQQENHCRFK